MNNGKRIELVYTNDQYTDLKAGDRGTQIGERIDPWGDTQIYVRWDNGSSLSLIEGHDEWREVKTDA